MIKLLSLSITVLFLFTGCGFNHAVLENYNSNLTNVELSSKNFIVLDRITGESTATYIFGIGGKSHKALLQDAMTKLYNNANLNGGAKALVNVTYETHTSTVIIYSKKTLTASGNVIEFTK